MRSALALAQAQLVAQMLQAGAGGSAGPVEIVPIVTRGDRESAAVADTAGEAGDGPSGEPPPGEDKSRWVSELERALLSGEIDAAVHSAKDVPGELAEGLALAAAPPRAAAEDVLCGAGDLHALPADARVGTSSIRRVAQLRAARDELEPLAMHGNVDTRLRKLAGGEFDAIVVARAGLQRLGLEQAIDAVLDPARFVPAPGQGALALEVRAEDESHARGAERDRRRRHTDLPAGRARTRARAWRELRHAARRLGDYRGRRERRQGQRKTEAASVDRSA